MIKIEGDFSYSKKDQIGHLGGRWDGSAQVWMVPADKAEQAAKILAPKTTSPRATTAQRAYRPVQGVTTVCRSCGTYCYGDCHA